MEIKNQRLFSLSEIEHAIPHWKDLLMKKINPLGAEKRLSELCSKKCAANLAQTSDLQKLPKSTKSLSSRKRPSAQQNSLISQVEALIRTSENIRKELIQDSSISGHERNIEPKYFVKDPKRKIPKAQKKERSKEDSLPKVTAEVRYVL